MPVDVSSLLHVLAHELRTPAGIAQGYLRLLLDDRLTEAADRRRAIEQTQKAVARMSELTAESSRLARWLEERRSAPRTSIDAHALVTRVVSDAGIEPLRAKVDVPPASIAIATVDGDALADAIVSLVKVTAREMKNEPCAMVVRVTGNHTMDVLIGSEQQLDALSPGPDAPGAGPLGLERGGVGLSLVLAAAVLETHGARHWTVAGLRTTVGIRFPFEERSHL
jgi:phospho-acceptor domain-containing protein